MNSLAYDCLKGFDRRFKDSDNKPLLHKLGPFEDMMEGDFSGQNLVSRIITTDEFWENMLNTKGFGRGVKYKKAQVYRKQLITTWKTIKKVFDEGEESEISKMIGLYLWDLKEEEFSPSYLGLLEEAIIQNKLWRNPIISDIFSSLFFIPTEGLESLHIKHNIDRERIRQLKVECLENFEQDFWFIKNDLFKNKLKQLFDLDARKLIQIKDQTIQVNNAEHLPFSKEFYIIIISISFDMILIGNIHDLTNQNDRSSSGNIWSNLYLQTKLENKRCNIQGLINTLAIELNQRNYLIEQDVVIDISSFIINSLTDSEIEYYNSIISLELELNIELNQREAVIKRNSYVTQPEMLENALRELNGFAYADDILSKVSEMYPEKDWTMPVMRGSFRGENFYAVGKSGLFGLKEIKDVREEMGNGTINEVTQIYLAKRGEPCHIYELLEHINELFPRPKTLHSLHTILEQNSRNFFKKFEGGFYGLLKNGYKNTEFPKVVGGHGAYMRRLIHNAKEEGISFANLYEIFHKRYGLLEIQIKYLLGQMVETNRINFINGYYYLNRTEENFEKEENDNSEIIELDVEIDQDQVNWEELNQPDMPDEFVKDSVAQIKIRRGQPRFRHKLLKLYKNTCIITGCSIPELLEAAHIMPHSEKNDYRLSNGLLLRTDIHTLFDLSMIAIDPDSMFLKINEKLLESREYAGLNNTDVGSRINRLHKEYSLNKKGLNWRWNIYNEMNSYILGSSN